MLAGCGRIGFDVTPSNDANGDGPGTEDTPTVEASKCGATNVVICDGFEGLMFDARWAVTGTGGTAALDTTRAYRGSSSAHFHTNPAPAGDPSAVLRTTEGLAGAITGTVYLRAWAYFASPYPIPIFNQVLNVVNNMTTGVSMGTRDGFARTNDYAFLQSRVSSTVMVPVDRWTCLQLQVPSNVEGATRVFVDGVEATDVALMTPGGSPQPAADHIYVGVDWITTMAVPATDAWLDELIVDTQPTTCAQ